MSLQDTCCTIVPYFEISPDKSKEFKELCNKFVARAKEEDGCLHYAFSFNGNKAHCREGYRDAEAILYHINNVADLLGEAANISKIIQLEIHGPEGELQKLQEPLKDLNPNFFYLECGFRR